MKKLLLILLCLPLLTLAQKTYVPDGCFEIFLENNAMGDGIYGNDSVLTSNIMNVLTLNIANPCANNIITDVTGLEDFTALEYLSVHFSGITRIDLSQNYYLEGLNIDETLIDSLDCSNNPLLTYLSANNCNLTFIDISQSTSLIELSLMSNFLTSLNLSNHTALRDLDVKFNNLTSLDLRNIDINNFTGMYNHPIWTGSYNATLETTGNYQLSCIDVDNPSLADSLIPVNYFGIESFHNFSSDCDAISGCTDTLALNFDSIAIYENYTCIYGKTFVPDDNFEAYLEANGMGDSINSNDSVLTVNIITVQNLFVNNQNISDLTGIENFIELQHLECESNSLTVLDLSNNTQLRSVKCVNNQLTNLELNLNNTYLNDIYCQNNLLTNLDVSGLFLFNLNCSNNQLNSLNLKNIISIPAFNPLQLNSTNNLNLYCIDVDNPLAVMFLSSVYIDPWTSFDTNCVIALGCIDSLANNYDSTATIDDGSCYYGKTYVPDGCFEAFLENNAMGDGVYGNDSVLTANIRNVEYLWVGNGCTNSSINNIIGIQDFISLKRLFANNHSITKLDLSQNDSLGWLQINYNPIDSLDLSNNTELYYLSAEFCNNLEFLDISQNTSLLYLDISSSSISSLDLSSNTSLRNLDVLGIDSLLYLDLRNIDILNFTGTYNYPFDNYNYGAQIAMGLNNQLNCISVDDPVLSDSIIPIDGWTRSSNQNFNSDCNAVSGCKDTLAANFDSTAIYENYSCLYEKTYVPDDNFESYLESVGLGDGVNSNDSVNTEAIISHQNLYINNLNISDLTGIENFVDLRYLDCSFNALSFLDLANKTELRSINCSNNQINNLILPSTASPFFEYLVINNNQLTNLNFPNIPFLIEFNCSNNQFTNLDLSQTLIMGYFDCSNNQLNSLNFRNQNTSGIIAITFNSINNLDLYCIDVDNPSYYNTLTSVNIDLWSAFDTNCVTALGCTDSTACNYIPNATVDDGSCLIGYGCTDSLACNYNSTAQCDDGSCLTVYGCTDSLACNYNSTAQCDDGGCTYLSVTLNDDQVICPNFSDATLTVNYNTGSYTFIWSNGETTQSIDSLPMGSYSVIVTDSSGCSTNLNANVTLAPNPAFNMFPEICYVTVDSATGNNKVIVKPMANLLTSKFIIYKESSANIYSPIDTINSNILDYLDVSSNPMAQSYRYKISVLDTCSNESVKSDFHKTIHLTMSLGLNGEVNLLWNNYEGYQPSDYLIFRSVNNGAMNQVGILPGTNLTYTDLTPPTGNLNYQARAIAPNCNIIPFAKNSTSMLVSNVINHSTTAVNELVNSKKVIKITDILGRETKGTKNQPLFYIYDDGTVEKKLIVE